MTKTTNAALLVVVALSCACDFDIDPTQVEIRPTGDGVHVPSYEFMTREESQMLRDSFDWNQTPPVEEREPVPGGSPGTVDPGGPPRPGATRPALHYAMVYVQTPDHLLELDEMQAHVRALPLFESEWEGVPEEAVKFPFSGDGEGMFVYAIMPGEMLNAIRAEALAGEETFRAVVLRDVPGAARTETGSVSYEYLKQRGFDYDVDDIVREALIPPWGLEEDGKVESTDAAPKRPGRRLRRFAKRIRDLIRGTVDAVREAVAAVATAVAPDTAVMFNLIPIETDPDFGGGTPTSPQMVRAWGPSAGTPMNLTDTRYVVRQFYGLSIKRDRTDAATGAATETVVTSQPFKVCAEAFSSAAELERSVIWPVQVCSADITPAPTAMFANVNVLDTDFNILMQAIDGYNYSQQVLGFTPRRAIIQVGVLNELIALFNRGRSVALCGSRTSTSVSTLIEGIAAGGLPIPGVGLPLEVALANDIAMLDASGTAANENANRMIATHEYGHFVLCDLLAQTNPNAFDRAWSTISVDTLLDRTEAESEARALNEGFADWFAAQVSGATNYVAGSAFLPAAATAPGIPLVSNGTNSPILPAAAWYADPGSPALGGGLEENYGAGTGCTGVTYPRCQFSGTPLTVATPNEAVSEMASLYQDLVDGWPVGTANPGAGAAWRRVLGTPAFVPLAPTASGLVPFADEPAQLSGPQFLNGFRIWALRPFAPFDKERVFESFTQQLSMSGLSPAQICQTYALHTGLVCDMDWLTVP